MAYVDLHTHSTASDGALSPAEVVRLAWRSGLVGLALTDHDTVGGLADAASEALKLGLTFVPAIEISCQYPPPGVMHLLGYCIDPTSPAFVVGLRQLVEARDQRNPKIVAKLNEMGVHITMDEVRAVAGGVVGRPHIAETLVHKGYVNSVKAAFDKYLASDAPAYVEKERLSPRQAIDLIHSAGGLAVLAHPLQLATTNDAQLERVVKDLVDLGLDGLETMHSDHDAALIDKYTALARRYGLLTTGGSDFHAASKGVELGVVGGRRIAREVMDRLLARASSHPREGDCM